LTTREAQRDEEARKAVEAKAREKKIKRDGRTTIGGRMRGMPSERRSST
jgi:hypothetical protein